MENDINLDSLIHEFCENVSETLKPVIETIKNIMDSLSTTFLEAWKSVNFDFDFFNKNISRKRFTKLLMSIGYQRNEANKIAWEYHRKNGKYTILDFMTENKRKEDLKNDLVRN